MADTSYSDLNIVALGDSITYSVNHATGWVSQLQSMFPDARIVNAGVPGDTLSGMAVRMQSYVPEAGKQNIMIIWGGTNDLLSGSDPATAAAALAGLVGEAKSEGWETWVVDALPRDDVGQAYIQQFDSDAYATVSADRFIDMYSYFTSFTGASETSLYCSDEVHPNSAGDARIVSVMAADIESATDSSGVSVLLGRETAASVSSTGASILGLSKSQSGVAMAQS